MKIIYLILVLILLIIAGCDTELGHSEDHDHDGDGVQDHAAEDHDDEIHEGDEGNHADEKNNQKS